MVPAFTDTPIADPDGNILEFMWMDPVAAEQGPEVFAEGQG